MENRLEEIKDNYAKEHDYENWTDFINDAAHWMVEKHMDDICQRYATECCQATLKKASEKLCENFIDNESILVSDSNKYCDLIFHPENIVLL